MTGAVRGVASSVHLRSVPDSGMGSARAFEDPLAHFSGNGTTWRTSKSRNACRSQRLLPVLLFMFVLSALALFLHSEMKNPAAHSISTRSKAPPERRPFARPKHYDFQGFNNITGLQTGDYLVPNIVHFLYFNKKELNFVDFIVVISAVKNQRPDRVLFHINEKELTGVYWEKLLAVPGFLDLVELVHLEVPDDIFGQKFDNGFKLWHAGDVTRIRILMKYGGIFLDNDSYLVRSLDKFRRFEMALGWDEGQFLGTQVLVAHPDARFLYEWLETYRGAYKSNLWYYNAGERPTKEVLWKRPELIHRVKLLFGVHDLRNKLYNSKAGWLEWRDQYAIHLLIRHQGKHFNETNFMQPPTTFRDVVLDLYDPISGRPRLVIDDVNVDNRT